MHPLCENRPGKKMFLLGNEAIVRGALEAGVGFVSTYPGTPSSEIGDTFYSLAGQAGVNFEYSVNEKVALETAVGAATSGVRTLCAMKHVGLNVAADPLMTLAYIGVRGGLVIISADDPGCHSSQNEQDNRYYGPLSQLPLFDPADPEEAYRMTLEAFEISEKFELPVILRTTTRVAHSRSIIEYGEKREPVKSGEFIKDPMRFVPVPAIAKMRHPILREQTAKLAAHLENSDLDYEIGNGRMGVISSGAGSAIIEDMLRAKGLLKKVRMLKIGVPHPLDRKRVEAFLHKVGKVLVVEELEPFLEVRAKAIAHDAGLKVKIFGKGTDDFSPVGEYTVDIIKKALGDFIGTKARIPKSKVLPPLPPRPPMLCAGCPHRTTYYVAKMLAGPDALFWTDIGCYTLGFAPPISVGDMFVCMGSSASSSGGASVATGKKIVAFIGDSTFFHSGMTGLANTLSNDRNVTLVIMDNMTTGMTGHQPHPGSYVPGVSTPMLSVEKIVRGMGVKNLAIINPKDLGKSMDAARAIIETEGPGVIISKSPCPMYDRKVLKMRREKFAYRINHDICKHCGREGECLDCGIGPTPDTGLLRSAKAIAAGGGTLKSYQKTPLEKMEHPPCEAVCPARICVQGYITQLAVGKTAEAIKMIRQRVALPNALCRICERPCEKVCIRGDYDDPVAINRLKRFAMDQETDADREAYAQDIISKAIDKKQKIAVIGAGPAGLQCAHDLRMRGFGVTVFEASSKSGGLARWGIPGYRLPRKHLKKDLRVLELMGVDFVFNKRFGLDFDEKWLREESFSSAFLGIGQNESARLGIPGEDLPECMHVLEFLKQVNSGKAKVSGDVIVFGSGNAAMDAARSALRLGANKVKIIYRRTKELMPADPTEVQDALDEGISLETLTLPVGIEKHGKRLKVLCLKTQMEKRKDNKRPMPITIEGKPFGRMCDMVITAIGQAATRDVIKKAGVKIARNGRIKIDPATGATSDPYWFAGGDAVTGPASFVEALEAGKIAAYGIDLRLSGRADRVLLEDPGDADEMLKEKRYQPTGVTAQKRVASKMVSVKARVKSFREVEPTYTLEQAMGEAARCLTCGTCKSCNNCIDNFGCPAFYKENGQININPLLCDGCGSCIQICPNGAIEIVREEG